MSDFNSMGIPTSLLETLKKNNYIYPTPIQKETIPVIMQGKDIIATAQTGTGKTAAFLVPIITKLINSSKNNAIILAPTRELALQIKKVVDQLIPNEIFKTAILIGGSPIEKQIKQLKAKPRIIVATPGRTNDHLTRKSLNLKYFNILVLDEFDRMLDIGFIPQLTKISGFLPEEKQTLMFSATLNSQVIASSKKFLNNPKTINIGKINTPVKNIHQQNLNTTNGSKYSDLLSILNQKNGSVIIFVNTKRGADKLSIKLNNDKHNTNSLHGDLRHGKREKIINAFKAKNFPIMVATDIAARGLDIEHIELVVNYDLPNCPEDYIHRIGRTARAGATGKSLNLLVPEDAKKWASIKRNINNN